MTNETLSIIEEECYTILYCLLGSEKKELKRKGIEFIQEIYTILWNHINNCITEKDTKLKNYTRGFSLFSEIYSELINSIDELNIEYIEKFNFYDFIDSVLRVTIWLKYDNKTKKYQFNYKTGIFFIKKQK